MPGFTIDSLISLVAEAGSGPAVLRGIPEVSFYSVFGRVDITIIHYDPTQSSRCLRGSSSGCFSMGSHMVDVYI